MSAFPPPKGAGICALAALGTLGLGFVSCSIAHGATISTYGPYAAQTYEAPGLNPRAVGYITAGIAPTDARLPLATVLAVASPITLLRRDIPPTFIVHGTNDHVVPVQQSQSLDAEISYLGAQGTVLFTDGGHVFAGYASKTDRDQMMSAFGDFISAQALRP